MKEMMNPPLCMSRTRRITATEPDAESPSDRDLRRLCRLSIEVGAACSAWLEGKGLKTGAWGQFNARTTSRKRLSSYAIMENDS